MSFPVINYRLSRLSSPIPFSPPTPGQVWRWGNTSFPYFLFPRCREGTYGIHLLLVICARRRNIFGHFNSFRSCRRFIYAATALPQYQTHATLLYRTTSPMAVEQRGPNNMIPFLVDRKYIVHCYSLTMR
ncbi:hypothetical protein HYPSUDRAFT_719496 [Hypholoma sublateritium FD-334 SS-4]|uniref:Uncharacterized protein n=1 Tax=Hypholoma sublateritium (strain FD-334 SS-4) TaxID=945553 RepID=A0A0D2LL76_HYPSF|nr:hypothetical protein HYPSUDRAFT_719496 [Hypholoma sublateritium FD-334 SS-4]